MSLGQFKVVRDYAKITRLHKAPIVKVLAKGVRDGMFSRALFTTAAR